jgi:SPP1 gp7 family putative phage head morphogenesis protein
MKIDWNLPYMSAADWAKQNAGLAYPNLTQEQINAIRKAISSFYINHLNVGQVWELLSPYFDKETAEIITCTEITRASANAEQISGEKIQKDLGGIRIIKIWQTNNDNLVCPICRNLHGKKVDINSPFAKDIFIPPAHLGCRCTINASPDF